MDRTTAATARVRTLLLGVAALALLGLVLWLLGSHWEESQEACLDFSFVVDGQDWDEAEIAGSLALTEAVDGTSATVTARFTNFGEPRTLSWTLVRQGGVWRVADVASVEGAWRLSELSCG